MSRKTGRNMMITADICGTNTKKASQDVLTCPRDGMIHNCTRACKICAYYYQELDLISIAEKNNED